MISRPDRSGPASIRRQHCAFKSSVGFCMKALRKPKSCRLSMKYGQRFDASGALDDLWQSVHHDLHGASRGSDD